MAALLSGARVGRSSRAAQTGLTTTMATGAPASMTSRGAAIAQRLNPLAWWRRRRQRSVRTPVLPSYAQGNAWARNRRKLGLLLFILTWVYVAFFQLVGQYIIVQYLMPLALIAALVIWALPERRSAPIWLLEALFFAFLIMLLVWPDYLAIALPGLPWVTAVRLVGLPMAFILLYCLSTSTLFRNEIGSILKFSNPIWTMMIAFMLLAMISIVFSDRLVFSINKYIVALTNWLLVFVVSTYVLSRNGRALRFIYFCCAILGFWCLEAILEHRLGHVPWAGHIPSFLSIQDDSVIRTLAGSARAATGIYRLQAKFVTPLDFAEFIALVAPFTIYLATRSSSLAVRIACVITLMLSLYTIRGTDSRLGIVGFLLSFLLYFGAWAYSRWRVDRSSMFGPALTLAYPAVFATMLAGTFVSGRLRAVVWGNGAQQASTDGRAEQLAMSIPKILSHPWGYGIGRAAETVGFTDQNDLLTLDSYYLTTTLEFGIVGFVLFIALFGSGIFRAGTTFIRDESDERWMLVPAAISLVNFVVIKSVLSQQGNHPLAFMILGLVCALHWRLMASKPTQPTLAAERTRF